MHLIRFMLRMKREIESSTKKTKILRLSRNPSQCMLQVCGNALQQIEKFKSLELIHE